ncbi:ornithine cyclodeaminase family protein [Leeia oryzae]|uniref:ornithine cyclodeaminase family protein n=1 Tax=Leeia oryzae TaxID=356662 RepID=UPI000364302C|nr:ornithine cyclodeaminase family protein [Leeia oryzae]
MQTMTTIPVLDATTVQHFLPGLPTQGILADMFRALAKGTATQPAQTLSLFPAGKGDFICYPGVMADEHVFGVKLSPYIPTGGRPIVTAWSLLMSMQTGQPLLLCDAGLLTIERTAATTALAVDALARRESRILTLVGLGAVGQAHLRHVAGLRAWTEIRLFAADLAQLPEDVRHRLQALDSRVVMCDTLAEASRAADVVMLCTSSAGPVLDPTILTKTCLITSISTNAPKAHEIPPASLPGMDVYCDYRQTTPQSAGEMQIATELHGWHAGQIVGDLPELLSGQAALPDHERHVFFRSIGLGLEDVAIATALFKAYTAQTR